MHLFVDARKLKHGGIGRYIENLLVGFLGHESVKLSVLCACSSDVERIKAFTQSKISLDFYIYNARQYSLREYFFLSLKFRNVIKNCDWYIAPHYTLPYFIPIKKLVVIHDCIHITHPESFLHWFLGRIMMRSSLRRAERVLTVSKSSQKAIAKEFNFSETKIHVIHNSLLPAFLSMQNQIESKDEVMPRILFVGADKPHKRIELFIEFLGMLDRANLSFKAIILSSLSEDNQRLLNGSNFKDSVQLIKSVSNEQLLDMYKSANYLVSTSVQEGFCLPILEAMSAGLSVLAPRADFSEELLGDAGWYFEPGSAADLFRIFIQANCNYEERQNKIFSGLNRSKSYLVEVHALQFLEELKLAV